MLTWFIALILVALATGICLSLESVNVQVMQCICAMALDLRPCGPEAVGL